MRFIFLVVSSIDRNQDVELLEREGSWFINVKNLFINLSGHLLTPGLQISTIDF